MEFLKFTKKECIEAGTAAGLNDIEEARTDMLKAYLNAKNQLEYVTAYVAAIKSAALEEYETYGEKEVEMYGKKISKVEAGVKLDYSNCNHPTLEKVEKQMTLLKAEADALKKFLKGFNRPEKIKIKGIKQLVRIVPPIKTSTTTIKVS